MIKPIYLDYAATTPVAPEVAEAMSACLTFDANFGNAASRSHYFGWQAEETVEHARASLASLICADPREIVWTSGATEASNLAIKGVLAHRWRQGARIELMHVVTTSIEHKSVLDTCYYASEHGVQANYIGPTEHGDVDVQAIASAINEHTLLVSVMHANNETGSINDIKSIGEICRARGVVFHVDAAQTVGKLDIDVRDLHIDLMSISSHKFYGPKGAGAMFVRRSPDLKVSQQMHGGGHERGMRSGTLATHQIVGTGKAAELASERLKQDTEHLLGLRERFLSGLRDLPSVSINGTAARQLPGIVNLAFNGIDGETLLMSLRNLAVSSGSACMSASIEPSYVLTEMGLSDVDADSSLRFSFGRYTTENDIDAAVESIRSAVAALGKK